MPAMPNPYRLDLAFACQPVNLTGNASAESRGTVRFTGVAYSGGVIPSYGQLGDVAIDLATFRLPDPYA